MCVKEKAERNSLRVNKLGGGLQIWVNFSLSLNIEVIPW